MTKFSDLPESHPNLQAWIHFWDTSLSPELRNRKIQLGELFNYWGEILRISQFIKRDEPHTFVGNQSTQIVELESHPEIRINGSAGNYFRLRLTQDGVLLPPYPIFPGVYIITIEQDAIGNHALEFSGDFKFPKDFPKAISLPPYSQDVLSCLYDGISLKCTLASNFEV